MHTNFSRHAYERVLERLTMELDEVADLLDWDLAVKIGDEKGTRRIHRLFYSHDDHQCFIAIQDGKTKTVVTILPVDYYETLVAKIPQPSLVEAERLVSCPPEAKPKKVVTAPADVSGKPKVPRSFKIQVTFVNLHRGSRTVNLGSWPAESHGGSIARLLQDTQFFEAMRNRVNEEIQPDEYAARLLIRLGKRGEEVWVNIEDEGSEPIRLPAEASNL